MSLPTVVYIVGPSHSGSTLLGLLLGTHSRSVMAGELKVLSTEKRPDLRYAAIHERGCSCGAAPRRACPFWSAVEAEVGRRSGLSLWTDVDLACPDPAGFVGHNETVLRALARVAGRDVIVDTSKSVPRLRRLLDAGAFDVRPVSLTRDPRGVVFSNVRKGRDWRVETERFRKKMLATQRCLDGVKHFALDYEGLVSAPRQTVAEVTRWLGLRFEEGQLRLNASEAHIIGGNRWVRTSIDHIEPDLSWKTGLSLRRRIAIRRRTRAVHPSR